MKMNKYLKIILHLDKEPQIKWWLLKHYRSFINRIIALKQTTPLTLNGTILHKLLQIIIYGKTEQDGEPTPETPVEIKNVEGKNKFDLTNFTAQPSSSLNYEVENNHLVLTATGTTGAQYLTKYITGLDSSKKYTLSFKAKKTVKGTDGNSVILIRIAGSNDGTTYTTLSNLTQSNPTQGQEYNFSGTVTGYTYYRFFIYNNSGTPVTLGEETEYWNIQIEEGSVSTPYVPYNSIEFKVENSDGTEEQTSYFTFEEGQYLAEGGYLEDRGIHNVYSQKTLNGTEDWRSAGTAGQYYGYYLQVSDMKSVGSIPSNNFWCDSIHFVTDSSHAEEGGGYIVQRNFVIFSSESSVNNFKTWLSNHNIILQYELANPTPTPYTPTQATQWNAIKNMYTYKDQTNINVLANLDGIEIDIGYYGTNVLSQETLEELSNGRGD